MSDLTTDLLILMDGEALYREGINRVMRHCHLQHVEPWNVEMTFFTLSAERGYPDAKWILTYLTPSVVGELAAEKCDIIDVFKDVDDARAMYLIGLYGWNKHIVNPNYMLDYIIPVGNIRKAALRGHAAAQGQLAFILPRHRNTDKIEAVDWLQKAADQDDPFALFQLGGMHRWDSQQLSPPKAREYFKRACERNFSPAFIPYAECINAFRHISQARIQELPTREAFYWVAQAFRYGLEMHTFLTSVIACTHPDAEKNCYEVAQPSDLYYFGRIMALVVEPSYGWKSIPANDNRKQYYMDNPDRPSVLFQRWSGATQRATLCCLWFCEKFTRLPRDIRLIIARDVWVSREDPEGGGWTRDVHIPPSSSCSSIPSKQIKLDWFW